LKYNIDAINEYIVKKIPIPVRDFTSDPRLIVIRSFDVNKPGAEVDELKGGVAGGSILRGVLKVTDLSEKLFVKRNFIIYIFFFFFFFQVGDEIEVRPGILTKDNEGQIHCRPIFSRIVSLFAEHNDLKFAVPGGLIGSYLYQTIYFD